MKKLSALLALLPGVALAQPAPAPTAVCGDAIVQGAEACDDGPRNSDALADACRADCTRPACGDGVKDAGEVCDDGNNADNDACRSDCLMWTGPESERPREERWIDPATRSKPESPAGEEKSPQVAMLLSAAGTAAPLGLLLLTSQQDGPSTGAKLAGTVGLVIGPYLGHLYAGQYRRGATLLALRAGSAGVALVGSSAAVGALAAGFAGESGGGAEVALLTGGVVAAIAGGGGFFALTAYSIADAGASLGRREPRAKPGGQARWLIPAPVASPDGKTSLGLAFGGSF